MKRNDKIKLTKVKGGAGVRTQTVEGVLINDVEIGHGLFLIGEPLNKDASFRQVNTSKIVKIENLENSVYIHTETGSIYKLEYLKID